MSDSTTGAPDERSSSAAGSGGSFSPGGGSGTRRRRLTLAGVAALLVAGIVTLVLVLGNDRDTSTAADETESPATTSASPSAESPATPPPTPTPTGPTENVEELPAALPAVPLDGTAQVGNGMAASIARIEGIEGEAQGPGNVSGPALRVTIRIENGTSEAVSLEGVAVNLAYGSELTPASPLEDSSQAPFSGTVAPGATAEGVYVFSVPADAREAVTIDVGYQAGAPRLIFSGPVR